MRTRHSLKTNLLLSSLIIVILALLSSGLLSLFNFRNFEIKQEENRLINHASYLRDKQLTQSELAAYAQAFSVRITNIRENGEVSYDSAVNLDALDNHRYREEVKQAFAQGIGMSIRSSSHIGETLVYVAVRTDANDIIRVSRSFSFIQAWTKQYLVEIIFAFVALAILSALVVTLNIRHTTKALTILTDTAEQYKAGNLSHHSRIIFPVEYALLCDTLNSMATQLQEQFQELAASSLEYQTLLNAMHEGVILLDKNHVIQFSNTTFDTMFAEREQAKGHKFEHLIASDDILPAIDQAFRGIATSEDLFYTTTEAHSKKQYQVRLAPVLKHGQGVYALVLTFFDITRIRKLEDIRKDFVANVSHELKTPLTAIAGFAELANQEETPVEEVRQFASIIYNNTKRMQSLVEDLLLLASLEDHKREVPLMACTVKSLLDQAYDACRHVAEAKQIQISLAAEPSLSCKVNEGLIVQALINLMMNALQYSENGTHITARAYQVGNKVSFSVQDEGCGIAKADQDRIFERFYRVDKARSRKEGGTGLGLSIVKHIASIHHGTVGVTSTPGQGSTFVLTILQ
ncbi:MAG: ATP-binding protein [Sphaerochaeta sp.]|uniref:HAMP domain-containing sensor histidine kinase n=1 Tax=Sphaerochaeta sp. TaxID=1972642 RepID=UPI002FCADD2F